jgi:Mn-containing catalase
MFSHRQELQFKSKPEQPDAVYARDLQEVLGGQYDEITVAMHYLVQGWNMHTPGRYRDLILRLGVEQVAHVEMLATMIAQLLERTSLGLTGDAVRDDPAVAAVIGGTDLQQAIAAGAGVRPMNNPWQSPYLTAGGNLLADFQTDANSDLQSRQQAARLYQLTDDSGVRYLLSCLQARAAAHQTMCRVAVARLQEAGAV